MSASTSSPLAPEEKSGLLQGDDPREFLDLTKELQDQLLAWILSRLQPGKRVAAATSYGMKWGFETAAGIYITNGQFKGAMLMAGFLPVDPEEKNWEFRVKLANPRRGLYQP